MREAPAGSYATTPSVPNLVSSLREMVDAYWGKEGDGGEPPSCIAQAKILLDTYDAERSIK